MIIPNNLTRKDFNSTGEYLVYRSFQRDSATDRWIILHSVFLQSHVRNLSGEIDFLVIAPNKGVFIIEVKHGYVSKKDGEWIFKGVSGQPIIKKRGPFEQANEALHSLRRFLIKKSKGAYKDSVGSLLFGTGVIFSSMETPPEFGTEAEPWQVMGRNEMTLPISYFIESLHKGWVSKMRESRLFDKNSSLPSQKITQHIADLIKGDFEIKPQNSAIIQDNNLRIESFTKEQFELIEFTKYNDRALITGSAGTGKTLIALEIAVREIKKGRRVALLCYNRNLGNYLSVKLQSYADQQADYAVNSFHQFLIHFSNLKVPPEESSLKEFFTEDLPLDVMINSDSNGLEERFDTLIIDEAQDLLTDINMEVFDVILKGGMANGRWFFFGDFNKQAIYQQDGFSAQSLMTKYAYTHLPPLNTNCRNGKNIILYNTYLTGVKRPKMFNDSLENFPVDLHFPATGKQAEQLLLLLESIKEEHLLMHTVILSPYKFEKTPYSDSVEVKEFLKANKVSFDTIHSFKGLEKNIVILLGFEELTSDIAQKLLYVGISRAKQRLIFVFDKKLEQEFQKIITKNMHENESD